MKNIINFIRAQRLSWFGHTEKMQVTRMVKAMITLLETHLKKANRKTKDTLGG
jgi:Holliday junction resolvasome RuvABC endonuclease subunit